MVQIFNQIHEETIINDCPQTVCDMRRFITLDSSNTSIFVDKQDPLPTQAIVTNIFPSRIFQSCRDHSVCGHSLRVVGLVLVNGTDVGYTKEGTYFTVVYRLNKGKTIKCKFGYVRVGWNEVKYLQNRIGCIDKIVPSPKPVDEHNRSTKDSLNETPWILCY